MAAKEIKSLQHPLVKKALALRENRQAREEEMRVVVSGRKFIHDLAAIWPIEILFYIDAPPPLNALETIQVSMAILKKITGLEEPDGWAAIVRAPDEQPLQQKNHLLVLDQISDPGNLGTLWRTALALGWEGVWLTPGCVDPLNDKALRAAQGATFRLPYERVLPEKILEWPQTRKASLYVANLHGTPLQECKVHSPYALVLGNEGQGPGNWTIHLPQVTIPIARIESLNVASAGAIFLYVMRPTGRP